MLLVRDHVQLRHPRLEQGKLHGRPSGSTSSFAGSNSQDTYTRRPVWMLILPVGFVISILSLILCFILTRHRRKNKAPLAAYNASYGAQNANAGPAYGANPAGLGGQGTPLEVDGWQQQRQDQYNAPPSYAHGTGGGAVVVRRR